MGIEQSDGENSPTHSQSRYDVAGITLLFESPGLMQCSLGHDRLSVLAYSTMLERGTANYPYCS